MIQTLSISDHYQHWLRSIMYSMDLNLVKMGLDYTRRRKKWILLLAAFGFTGYGVYRVYHSPAVIKKRERLFKLVGALISIAEAASDSAETIGFVSKDLKEFLQSESDQIPNSLKQISKITRSDEFSHSVIRVTRALTLGILRGYGLGARNHDNETINSSSFADKVTDKLFSTAGSGFASVVVGSFARNLVMAISSEGLLSGGLNLNDSTTMVEHFGSEAPPVPKWLTLLCSDKCRELVGDCVQMFVSTAVAVYLDKTMDINTYDELFRGLTNPKHEEKVRDMLVSVCNGAVETLIRTSHEVLTSSNLNGDLSSVCSYSAIDDQGQGLSTLAEKHFEPEAISSNELKARNSFDETKDSGLVGKMFSTLAVPSNRRFVLDVTGRVTFETVRSFLELLLEKIGEGLKRSVDVVHETVVESSLAVVRYVTAKSSVIVTVCLSLYLHVLGGSPFLVPG